MTVVLAYVLRAVLAYGLTAVLAWVFTAALTHVLAAVSTDVRQGARRPSTGMFFISCLQVVASLQAERHLAAEHLLQAPPDPAHVYHTYNKCDETEQKTFLKKKRLVCKIEDLVETRNSANCL